MNQALRQLLQTIMTTYQQVVDSGEVLPDEIQNALAQYINTLVSLIESSSGAEGLAPTTSVPQVPQGNFPSSNVNGFKYNPDNGEMFVQFHGPYPQSAGPVYSYSGVPQYIFDIISRGAVGPKTSGKNKYHSWFRGVTPSLGASVNALLKAGGFSYRKVA